MEVLAKLQDITANIKATREGYKAKSIGQVLNMTAQEPELYEQLDESEALVHETATSYGL